MGTTARKRLFIGLLAGSCLLLILFLASLWVVPYIGLDAIHPAAKWVLGALVLAFMGLIGWAVLGLTVNVWFGRTVFSSKLRGVTVKLFLPLMTLLGRVVGISKTAVRNSFISVNNEMVLAEAAQYKPSEILLLLPHCLQSSLCVRRLTYDINNCKRCGECPIAALLDLHDAYGVHLAIATGGTIARRIVVQKRPKLIVAVACDRDLASGIQDTYPLPVYGVMNERPHGPCLDTNVSLRAVEKALLRFIDPQYLEPGRDQARGETIASGQAARAAEQAKERVGEQVGEQAAPNPETDPDTATPQPKATHDQADQDSGSTNQDATKVDRAHAG